MLHVATWYTGISNDQPVDIFFVEDAVSPDLNPIYANRVSAVTFEHDYTGNDYTGSRLLPVSAERISIESKTVRVVQIVEDQEGLRIWAKVPIEVRTLFNWSREIHKDETRRL